ncbi:MAG: glyoxalase [Saprospiraceae bacterium]
MECNKKSIRPAIVTEKAAESAAEQFQNEVLRPILKLQNDLLLAIVRHFLQKRKVKFASLSKQARLDWIAHSLRHDNRMRGLLLGTVIGQFTPEEWAVFEKDEAEFRRRITEMMTKRLQDQVEGLL